MLRVSAALRCGATVLAVRLGPWGLRCAARAWPKLGPRGYCCSLQQLELPNHFTEVQHVACGVVDDSPGEALLRGVV
jgi:hypothetical protein